MAIKILTDSASDLPRHLLDEYDIDVAPLMVILGDEEYYDRETIDPHELYAEMRNGKSPSTSQVPPERMKAMFEKYAKQQISCIYIGFSSELSGTYQTAIAAKEELLEEYPDFDIETFDSRSASIGEGFVALEAARLAKEGKSKEEILEAVSYQRDHMEHIFTVDNLEYLLRGGRISRTSAFVGNLLNIKPILSMNHEGNLIPIEKVRGSKKVYRHIVDMVKERIANPEKDTIGIPQADNPQAAEKLEAMIREETGAQNFITLPIGAVIGSHAGPGTFAAVFLKK